MEIAQREAALAELELEVPVPVDALPVDALPVPPVPELVLELFEPVPDAVPVPLVEPGEVFTEPDIVVDELPGVVVVVVLDGLVLVLLLVLAPGVVSVVDGVPVPLLEVLLLVLPPGAVVLLLPPGAVVVDDVLLESRVVVTSSRRVQAVSEASAIRVMAPAWAIFNAVMAVSLAKGCKRLLRFTDVPAL